MGRNLLWVLLAVAALAGLTMYVHHETVRMEQRLSHQAPAGGPAAPVAPSAAAAGQAAPLAVTHGQRVYVPVYSHVYHEGGRPFLVETTVSVHNVDPEQPITLVSMRYYNTRGEQVREHLEAPLRVGPFATAEFLVPRRETSGGSGANFLLEWVAETDVQAPLVEALHVGTMQQRAFAFATRGRVIAELGEVAAASPAPPAEPEAEAD